MTIEKYLDQLKTELSHLQKEMREWEARKDDPMFSNIEHYNDVLWELVKREEEASKKFQYFYTKYNLKF